MNFLKKYKLFVVALLVCVGILFAYEYIFKAPISIEDIEVDYVGTSKEFINIMGADFSYWNNKAVILTGIITTNNLNGIILDEQLFCQFKEKYTPKNMSIDTLIKIKGYVIGYDDLLEEIKLNQCIIIQP